MLSNNFLIVVEKCTECVTKNWEPCVFPFKHKGQTFNKCIKDGPGGPWCAIKTDDNKNVLTKKECDLNCDHCKESTQTTIGKKYL